jgi:hypothetical protein
MEDQEDRLNPHFQVLEEYLERPGAKCAQDAIRLVPTEESDLENRLSSLHVPFLELKCAWRRRSQLASSDMPSLVESKLLAISFMELIDVQRNLSSFIAANLRPPDANELTHKSESDQKIQGRWDGKGAVCLGEL